MLNLCRSLSYQIHYHDYVDQCMDMYIRAIHALLDPHSTRLLQSKGIKPRQESGSHLDSQSQTPDFWQIDTQVYFVRFSVFVESKEIFQQFNL